jgi:hypothetical protein
MRSHAPTHALPALAEGLSVCAALGLTVWAQVLVWERFRSKSTAQLNSRKAPIVGVLVNEKCNQVLRCAALSVRAASLRPRYVQIITVSLDKKIRVRRSVAVVNRCVIQPAAQVFDIRTFACLQTLVDLTLHRPHDQVRCPKPCCVADDHAAVFSSRQPPSTWRASGS